MNGVALILPPGWTLHAGGPHIALPLLKGFLQQQGIEAKLYDLNMGSVHYHQISISEEAALTACTSLTRSSMNKPYFAAEDHLQKIAQPFGGTWFAQEGYRHKQCRLSSPDSIREHAHLPSPFTEYFKKEAIPSILKHTPLIIGITLIVPSQILQTFELIYLLRAAGYSGKIVLGGNIVTRIYQDMALDWVFDVVDGIIQLQGEQALVALYKSLQAGLELSNVPNLMWRNQGKIISNGQKQLTPAHFEGPDFGDLPSRYWGTNYLTMLGARGCYYNKCSFCSIPFGYGKNGYLGNSPAANVLAYMKNGYQRYGIKHFKFVDEAFHPKLMRDLATLILAENFECTFEGYFRLEKSWLQESFLRTCYQAGLRKMYIGLELVPSDERDLLTKADGADPFLLLKVLHEVGIKTHVFCMFGFPGTGVKEAFETVDFALKHYAFIDTLDVFPFYYARHTQVEGVAIIEEPGCTWKVEHAYRPTMPSTLAPSQVTTLAEKLSDVIWAHQPQWLHPVYRMCSPWHDLSATRFPNNVYPFKKHELA